MRGKPPPAVPEPQYEKSEVGDSEEKALRRAGLTAKWMNEGKHGRGWMGRDRQRLCWPWWRVWILFPILLATSWRIQFTGLYSVLYLPSCLPLGELLPRSQSTDLCTGEMKGRKEDRRGERDREKVIVGTHTDESDDSHHCQGLGTDRAALVGGEIFHSPENIWFTLVWSSGGPRWRWGQGAGRSARRAAHRCLWLSSLAALALRSQITTVRWSYCAAISFPETKRPAQLQRRGSGQNTQAWKKLKVREQLSKAPRGNARVRPEHTVFPMPWTHQQKKYPSILRKGKK